jgi:lipopolysaccharide biosynthesis glycosyltransferase
MTEPMKQTTDEVVGQTSALEKIHIAFCLDNNYAEGTGVAAYSLCKNMAPEDEVVIHIVMSEPLQQKHRTKFQQLERMFAPRAEIRIYDDEKHVGWLDKRCGEKIGNWGASAFARLVLAELFPLLDKIIYLDGDMLVLSSLKNLWTIFPYRNYAIGAVAKAYYDPLDFEPQKRSPKNYGWNYLALRDWLEEHCSGIKIQFYTNSGVLLQDLRIIRAEHLSEKVIDWMFHYQPPCPDLVAINVVFHDRTLPCNPMWNVGGDIWDQLTYRNELFTSHSDDVAILHCAAKPKLWKIKPYEVMKIHHATLMKYIFLRPPTSWHKYRQESPWKHSIRSRFRELFATPEDRKLFKPIFAGIAATFVLTTSTLFYYLGRFFF